MPVHESRAKSKELTTYLQSLICVYVCLPLLLVGYRVVLGYPPSRLACHLAQDVAVAAVLVSLLGLLLYHVVRPVGHDLPPAQTPSGHSISLRATFHGDAQVPGDNETISAASVENTLGGGASNQLCRRIKSKARDS